MARQLRQLSIYSQYPPDSFRPYGYACLVCDESIAKEIRKIEGVIDLSPGDYWGAGLRPLSVSPLYDFNTVMAEVRALDAEPMIPDAFQDAFKADGDKE